MCKRKYGLAPHGASGLKSDMIAVKYRLRLRLAPHGASGLKYKIEKKEVSSKQSCSAWSKWIEIIIRSTLTTTSCPVLLRMEQVD